MNPPPPDPDFLTGLGFKAQDLCAGLAGGIVNVFVFKRSNPIAIIGSAVVGALTANYLSESALNYVRLYIDVSAGAVAFIVGLCAMALCQSIVEKVSKWKPKLSRTDVDAS
jgi:hypothetical protein